MEILKKYITFTNLKNWNFVRSEYGLFVVVFIVSSLCSCGNRSGSGIDQGEIHFSIAYVGQMMGIKKEIMPKQMVVSFKDDKVLFDMTSNIGRSGIMILSNPDDDIYDMYCSVLTSRYYYGAKSGEMYPGFGAMKGIVVEETSKEAVICGYNAHCAEVTLPSKSGVKYEVWYTKEIDLDNPNRATPFKDIDGVILKFFYVIGDLEMHFSAENVYSKNIDDALFDRKKGYILATKESIDRFIVEMINY